MLRKINHVNFMVILTIAFPLTACDGGKMPEKISLPTEVSKIDDSAWKALSEKRILFGHQPVGDNIIDGVQDLRKKHSRIQLDTTN